MDLTELWTLLRRGWLLLLISVILGTGLGASISALQPELYSASATGYLVTRDSPTDEDTDLADARVGSYLPLIKSRSVFESVAKDLGIAPERVSLEGANDGAIITVTSTADTPSLAREMADTGIQAMSVAVNDLATMTISGESSGETVVRIVPVEMAEMPTRPVSPNWPRNLALGLALGILSGFGLIVLRHSLDRKARVATEIEEITGAASLSIVPAARELAEGRSLAADYGSAAEALRQLRTNLLYVNVDSPARSIVVTSANQGEGKSTIAMQLAILLAESGEPTVIVDADLRRPRVAKLLGIDGALGLTQVLAGSLKLSDAILETSQPNLTAIPAGRIPPNPSEILGSKRMESLVQHLAKTRTVIIDAAPLLPVTDGGLVSAISDGALLVVQHGKTRREQVALATRNLHNVDGTLLGFVMNQVSKRDLGSAAYGYGEASPQYYYGEGIEPQSNPAEPVAQPDEVVPPDEVENSVDPKTAWRPRRAQPRKRT